MLFHSFPFPPRPRRLPKRCPSLIDLISPASPLHQLPNGASFSNFLSAFIFAFLLDVTSFPPWTNSLAILPFALHPSEAHVCAALPPVAVFFSFRPIFFFPPWPCPPSTRLPGHTETNHPNRADIAPATLQQPSVFFPYFPLTWPLRPRCSASFWAHYGAFFISAATILFFLTRENRILCHAEDPFSLPNAIVSLFFVRLYFCEGYFLC